MRVFARAMRCTRRLLPALGLWSAALCAQAPVQEVHGTSDTFAGHGVAIAWGVLRGATEASTFVVLRIAADPARFSQVAADGIDPFSKERQPVAAERPLGASADIRIPRARFADFPRTELRFSKPGAQPALVVYYLGVPDTTPEFAAESSLDAHLAQSLSRLRANIRKTP
ncbi:MAG: hypothetical protein ABI831_26870 [Betaproteobacteria bacterium]